MFAPFSESFAAATEDKASDYSKLVGTWIISPQSFDFFIEVGALSAEYPLLLLDEDKQFRIYLLGKDCSTSNGYFPNYPYPLDMKETLRCASHVPTRQKDLLNTNATLISFGSVQQDAEDKWRLVPEDAGQSMLQRIEAFEAYGEVKKAEIFREKYFIWMTSYAFQVRDNTLEFDPGSLIFSKYSKDALIDAGMFGFVNLVPNRRYFRCILNAYEGSISNKAIVSQDELNTFRILARKSYAFHDAEVMLFKAETEHMLAQEKDGDASRTGINNWNEAHIELKRQTQTSYVKYYDEIEQHPIYQAGKKKRLGAYLGCPERDETPL